MSRRFEYTRMTAQEFRADLDALGMPALAFGRIFGFTEDRIKLWLTGQQEIPIWVPIVTRILTNVPGAIPEARQAAAERISHDNLRPQDGQFPYLAKEPRDAD